jgi:hypothetical protein
MKKILFILAVSLKAQSLLSNVTAYWKFDETAPSDFTVRNTYADSTGLGNTLTVNPDQRAFASSQNLVLAANANTTQNLTGALASWGKWHRLLTTGEKAALAGGETWPFLTTTTLQDADYFYLLNESSSSTTYADATTHGNTLTRTGTTTQVTGPSGIAHGTSFSSGSYLSAPASPTIQVNNNSFTIAGWYNLTSLPSGDQSVFIGQINLNSGDLNDSDLGYVAYYQGAGGSYIAADLSNGIDLFANATIVTSSTPSTSTWYQMLEEYNATSSVLGVSVNNGTDSSFGRNIQPGAVSGKINNAAHFFPAPLFSSSQSGWDSTTTTGPISRLTATNNSNLTFGNNSRTAWFWFKSDVTSTTQSLAGFYQFTSSSIDWLVQVGSNNIFFITGNSAGTFQFCSVPFTDTTSYHLLVVWFDKTTGIIHLNLDHGVSVASQAITTFTPTVSTLPFMIGANQNGTQSPGVSGANQQFLGTIDEFGIANGTPSPTDLNTLWNSGNGITFPLVGQGGHKLSGQLKLRGQEKSK